MDRLDFSKRAELSEQIDGPCSYEDLRACLRDLAVMNRITRAHRPTMLWLERVLCSASKKQDVLRGKDSKLLKLVDVGCGYGDMLRRIERWAAKRGIAMELVGVDVNANAVRAAREAASAASRVQYVLGDACSCAETQDNDLITVSAVTHHLSEAEIVRLLRWMEQTARIGWLITDLHRMPTPYRIFSLMARGPWWHRFIRPDGLASIRRAFREDDWVRMCAAAGMEPGAVEIQTQRPARLTVCGRKSATHALAGYNSPCVEGDDSELPFGVLGSEQLFQAGKAADEPELCASRGFSRMTMTPASPGAF